MYEDIYKFLQQIPHGKVTTYKVIAEKFNTHPRTVGMIMGKNKSPHTYPCYKVIRSNGELGEYSSKKGLKEKREKLRQDGIEIIGNKIDEQFIWYG